MSENNDIMRFYEQVADLKNALIVILYNLDEKARSQELEQYYSKLELAKLVNAKLPIELFYKHGIITFHKQIKERDESFFLGKLDTLDNNDNDDLIFIGQIRPIWGRLSDKTKDNLWKYILVICILCERIVVGKGVKSLFK